MAVYTCNKVLAWQYKKTEFSPKADTTMCGENAICMNIKQALI